MQNVITRLSMLALAVVTVGLSPRPAQATSPQAMAEYGEALKEYNARNWEKADEHCSQGLKALAGQKDDQLKVALYKVSGQTKAMRREFATAEANAQLAVTISERLSGKRSPYYAEALCGKVGVYNAEARFDLATPLAQEAVDILTPAVEKAQKEFGPSYAEALTNQFNSLMGKCGDYQDAAVIGCVKKLLTMKGKQSPSDFDVFMAIASGSAQAGDVAYANGKNRQAQELYERALKLYGGWSSKAPGPIVGATNTQAPYPSILSAMQHLSEIYKKAGRDQDAQKLDKELTAWKTVLR